MSSFLFLMPAAFTDIKENVTKRANNGRMSDAGKHLDTHFLLFFSCHVVIVCSSALKKTHLCLINGPAFVPCAFPVCFQFSYCISPQVFFGFARALPFLFLLPASICSLDFSIIFLKLTFCFLNLSRCLALCENPDNSWQVKHSLNTQGLINQWNTNEQRKQAVKIWRQEA